MTASLANPIQSEPAIHSLLEKLIKKSTDDMEKRRYNTAIASMMEFTNAVGDASGLLCPEDCSAFVKLLAPFAPHVSEELWSKMNGFADSEYSVEKSIHTQRWPVYDSTRVLEDIVRIVVQINGKIRDILEVLPHESADQEHIEKLARSSVKLQSHLQDKQIKKVIFVSGKLMNFVV